MRVALPGSAYEQQRRLADSTKSKNRCQFDTTRISVAWHIDLMQPVFVNNSTASRFLLTTHGPLLYVKLAALSAAGPARVVPGVRPGRSQSCRPIVFHPAVTKNLILQLSSDFRLEIERKSPPPTILWKLSRVPYRYYTNGTLWLRSSNIDRMIKGHNP